MTKSLVSPKILLSKNLPTWVIIFIIFNKVLLDNYNYITEEWFRKTKAVPVAHEWIVECISQYKLVSLLDYLQAIMPEDVSALGFPEELLVDEGSDCEYDD